MYLLISRRYLAANSVCRTRIIRPHRIASARCGL